MILYQIAKWAEQNKQQLKLEDSTETYEAPVDLKALEKTEWYDVQNLKDTKLWMNGTLEHWILPQDESENNSEGASGHSLSSAEDSIPTATL
jgi:hypothetical protein